MSFQQGLSGLNASATNLDVIGNNIANTSTVGFKASQAQFADVYATSLTGAGGLQVGIGTKVADVAQSFSQGNVSATGNALDLAITGEGFFEVAKNGAVSYARNGQFHLDGEGYIVDNSLARLQGYAATNGVLATTPGSDLQVTFTTGQPQATSEVEMVVNLDADATVPTAAVINPAVASSYNHTTSVTVYDVLGGEHTMSLYFAKNTPAAGSVVWDVNVYMDGSAAALSTGTLTYSLLDGSLTAGALQTVTGTYPTGTLSGQGFSFDLNLTDSTMFADDFGVNTLTQDGYGPGDLAGLAVTKDGIIQAQYTNGQAIAIGQFSLTSFNNPNGLQSIGDNHWIYTSEAGTANTSKPNTGVLGLIQSGAVEESNVDLTAELVNLIVAQRMYQANAQTIRAQDQILQTLVNLR